MSLIRIKYTDQLVVKAKDEFQKGHYQISWQYLEDAHIFSQPYPVMHTFVHWTMLSFAFKSRDISEFFGQVLRLILAPPASIFKRYPEGNNGRSRTGIFTHFPIPNRIEKKLIKLDRLEIKRIKSGGESVKYMRQHPMSRK